MTQYICQNCQDCGWVCENHDDFPWGEGDECCGGAGMPCPECNACDGKTMPRPLTGSKPIWDIWNGWAN